MKDEQRELIKQAIGALKLRDITLHESSFKRPDPPPIVADSFEARQKIKKQVKFVVGDAPAENAQTIKLLQVIVALGLRVTGMADADPPIYFEIEADFMAEYEINSDVSQEAISAFATINSVHNVWPFWRHHVFDVVSRASLPHLNVPLYGGGELY